MVLEIISKFRYCDIVVRILGNVNDFYYNSGKKRKYFISFLSNYVI